MERKWVKLDAARNDQAAGAISRTIYGPAQQGEM